MNTRTRTLLSSIIARVSLGSVPVDGTYWFDPRRPHDSAATERPPVPDADWSPFSLSLSRPIGRARR